LAFSITLDRKSYNLFAARTLFKLVLVKFGKPSGKSGDLKGTGPEIIFPLGPLIFMFRARLHVPQGGAAKMPAKFGVSIQVINKD
jgi:hypothetical protein